MAAILAATRESEASLGLRLVRARRWRHELEDTLGSRTIGAFRLVCAAMSAGEDVLL
jgi:hypothetical protein